MKFNKIMKLFLNHTMRNITLLVSILLIMSSYSYSDETSPGYVNSTYGDIVKGSYGQCVHTAYYADQEGSSKCHENKNLDSSKPAKVEKNITESINFSNKSIQKTVLLPRSSPVPGLSN